MNATAVASPRQMFSSFGQPTQSSSKPVANPFATTTPATTTANPFGFGSASSLGTANTTKRDNPFADAAPAQKTSAFGGFGAPSNDGSAAAKQSPFGSNSNQSVSSNGANPFGGSAKPSTGLGGFSSKPPSAFPPSIASVIQDSTTDESPAINYDKNDPHAVKVYTQLRKDGLSPPAWPSQPGNPSSKAQMAKFREQYEEYRSKVRASLTRAGLIDDPTKRKALTDAIEFRGICQDMCPEYEKIQRITEHDIPQPERDPATTFADKKRMVKKLARSAAGQEAPLPMDVLSIKTLRKTLNYLIDDLLAVDENLPTFHGYLWDRTRAIRRDFSFFSNLAANDVKMQANVLEDIARFHVTSLHLLCREGKAPESFVEQQELEQLGKALLSLRDIYDDCNAQDIVCENEAEFRAYFLVFHANDPNIMDVLQRQWRRSLWTDSDEIQTAVSLVEALQNTVDFHGPLKEGPSLAASGAHQAFFRIVEDRKVSYTMACFAECHFPQLRRSILRNVKRALSRPKESANDVTAETLNRFLRFDTVQEAIHFAELHNLEFGASPAFGDVSQRPLILNNRAPLPHHRLKHQFSQLMVERKRGNRPLPEIIHSSVFETKSGTVAAAPVAEESLFVSEASSPASSTKPPATQPTESPFTAAPSTTNQGLKTTSDRMHSSCSITETASPFTTSSTPFASALLAPKTNAPTNPSPFPAVTPSPFQGFGKPSDAASIAKPPELTTAKPASSLTDKPAPSPFAGFSSGVPAATPSLVPATATSSTTTSATTATTPAKSPFSVESTTPKAPPKFSIGNPTFTPASMPASVPTTAALDTQKPLPGLSLGSSDASKVSTPLSPLSKDKDQPKQGSLLPTAPTQPANSSPFSGNPNPFNPASSTSSVPAAQKLAPPPPPPAPPRDRMKDFAEWFALGDSGLLEDFQTYLVEDMLKKVYVKYQRDTEEKRRKEEEERDRQTADNFRRRTLSVNYFYRWKANAREKRLRYLRKAGRDQLRQFHKRQHSSSHRGGSETPRRVSSQELPSARLQRQQELIDGLKQSANQQRAAGSIRASSVIVPASTAGNAIAESINRHFRLPMSVAATPSRSRSSSFSKGGAKTRALREELMGSTQSRFGRSGSSVASSDRSSPDNASRVSNVSERWRLKAMGIVQLPDGTAIPESLAHSQHSQYSHYQRPSTAGYLRRTPSFSGLSSRRESFGATSGSRFVVPSIEQSIPGVTAFESAMASNKRKRMTNESIMLDGDEGASSHKRVMSDAETLIQELRAMREEMEEGTVWFKEQNDKLHDASRGATPL